MPGVCFLRTYMDDLSGCGTLLGSVFLQLVLACATAAVPLSTPGHQCFPHAEIHDVCENSVIRAVTIVF
eukprot:6336427-Karenia_brevis.AAC.1